MGHGRKTGGSGVVWGRGLGGGRSEGGGVAEDRSRPLAVGKRRTPWRGTLQ